MAPGRGIGGDRLSRNGAISQVELFALSAQMRRAAVSIPSNIAEGRSRDSTREFLYFLSVSRGSLAELETQLELAIRLDYTDSDLHAAKTQTELLGKKINRLQTSLRAKQPIANRQQPALRRRLGLRRQIARLATARRTHLPYGSHRKTACSPNARSGTAKSSFGRRARTPCPSASWMLKSPSTRIDPLLFTVIFVAAMHLRW